MAVTNRRPRSRTAARGQRRPNGRRTAARRRRGRRRAGIAVATAGLVVLAALVVAMGAVAHHPGPNVDAAVKPAAQPAVPAAASSSAQEDEEADGTGKGGTGKGEDLEPGKPAGAHEKSGAAKGEEEKDEKGREDKGRERSRDGKTGKAAADAGLDAGNIGNIGWFEARAGKAAASLLKRASALLSSEGKDPAAVKASFAKVEAKTTDGKRSWKCWYFQDVSDGTWYTVENRPGGAEASELRAKVPGVNAPEAKSRGKQDDSDGSE